MRSYDPNIAFRGTSNLIKWFVNDERTKRAKDSVRPEEEGFHKITVTTRECEETITIFCRGNGKALRLPKFALKKVIVRISTLSRCRGLPGEFESSKALCAVNRNRPSVSES